LEPVLTDLESELFAGPQCLELLLYTGVDGFVDFALLCFAL
jgi:hypothetical protein